jgi:hypothetical protein
MRSFSTSRAVRAAIAALALTLITFARPTLVVGAPAAVERGLDVWVHASTEAVARDTFSFDAQAVGFPTATTTTPLKGAIIEATWDPDSLVDPSSKQKPSAPPPTVSATTDDKGRVTLTLPVPDGRPAALTLLVKVQVGDKERVRELKVQRVAAEVVELFVSDPRVVPGDTVPAWVLFSTRDRSKPIAGTPIEFKLTQGGVTRFRRQVTTDASGSAVVRVPIPRDNDPNITWGLSAAVVRPAFAPDAGAAPSASLSLGAREEIPGKPSLVARFEEGTVHAGGKVRYRVRFADASGEAVVSQPLWLWSGPRGTEAPKDDKEFKKIATKLVTDGAGYVKGELAAPSTVPLRGTTLSLDVRTELEGQKFMSAATIEVGRPRGTVEITAEGGELVPGIEQKVYLALSDDEGEPIAGTFTVRGDGLEADVTTNAHGEGVVSWRVPQGIGARRDVGPCPGAIAAQLSLKLKSSPKEVKAFDGALTGTDGLPLCVPVDRGATMLVRPAKSVVRAGEKLEVEIAGSEGRALSVLVDRTDSARTLAVWGTGPKVSIDVPESANGVLMLSVASPGGKKESTLAAASVLAIPKTLPKIEGKIIGGRAVPRGNVQLEARVTDERGAPVVGSVAAVVIDKFGGGSFGSLARMDTRAELCGAIGWVEDERCPDVLSGADAAETFRRSHLRRATGAPVAPTHDPGAGIDSGMRETFRTVVRSLEGAVFQASMAPETLPDVRRVEGGQSRFNPELMTLVTEAMSGTPETPGGEPLVLADIIAMDGQITYDNVARRVMRLKLFRVLSQVRQFRMSELPDPDEPALKEPNAILRKLLRDGTISDADLLDPWGGRLSFFKAGGESPIPYFRVAAGWELRSPGPDGRLGTGDDVRSPFDRVLKSGSPYAEAVEEDAVVDARIDLRVADSTVAAWEETLNRSTGDQIGDSFGAGGIGLSGIGSGGGGMGSGVGLGSIGGRHSGSVQRGIQFASPPARTDENGRVVIDIPLGDIETTWSIALVAIPDAARPALTVVDVPVTIPLSSKVSAGSVWTDGDAGEAVVTVRNRTDRDLDVALALSASGAIQLQDGQAQKAVKVRSQGAATAKVKVRATAAGTGTLRVHTTAPGAPDDDLTFDIEVRHKGELMRIARATYVTTSFDFTPYLKHEPMRPEGLAELVLERGDRSTIEGALDAVDPAKLSNLESLAESIDAASMIREYAIVNEGDGSRLAKRAEEAGRAATAKLYALTSTSHALTFSLFGRAERSGMLGSDDAVAQVPGCPSDATEDNLALASLAAGLDAEPPPEGGSVRDCWATYVVRTANKVRESDDPALVARALLAFARRPHRSAEARRMTDRLFAIVSPTQDGNITTPGGTTRADRATIYAALLVATDPAKAPAWRVSVRRWLMVQRDADGGFGSAGATRAAIQALLRDSAHSAEPKTP